jgi:hypothetical protein
MVFILVLICIRKKLSLGNAFILGAIFLSALFGLKPLAMLKSMVVSILDPKTLSIAGIVSLILILSNSMEMAGQMQRLLDKFRGLVSSPRLNLCFLLSNEHFGVSMGSVYKHLWWPCSSLIAASIIYFGILHWLRPWM